ncbi:DUT [Hepatospora eriocheir]|uniref:Deoxyuridine 5'-triphosphate nucleotidohydrolase n=1 Tax=Hepatospora eriocheir TaxID=1081669 RepID=A0A1X0QDK1_9MICR|nr:DUT [Hepatospora eriocheir]
MKQATVIFTKLTLDSTIPCRHSKGAAGYDLYCNEDIKLQPSDHISVSTGIKCEIPSHLFGLVLGRSGVSSKNGVEIIGYIKNNEEIKIEITNCSNMLFETSKNTRIAQLVFLKRKNLEFATEHMNMIDLE